MFVVKVILFSLLVEFQRSLLFRSFLSLKKLGSMGNGISAKSLNLTGEKYTVLRHLMIHFNMKNVDINKLTKAFREIDIDGCGSVSVHEPGAWGLL